jgi:protein-disulfide isomerase
VTNKSRRRAAERAVESQGFRTALFVVVALVIGFAGGIGYALAFVDGGGSAAPETGDQAQLTQSAQPVVFDLELADRPTLGNPESLVTVVEMTDYECPFCRRHHAVVLPVLLEEYGDRIRYVAVNFPLTSIHALAFTAALAAECAHDQGRFWDYNEALFSSPDPLVPDTLLALAAGLGLDMPAFTRCLETESKRDLVVTDVLSGQRFGASGTPTFFINGKRLVGARPIEVFRQAIDSELALAGGD